MSKLPLRARLATSIGGAAGRVSRLTGRGDGSVIGGVLGLRVEPELLRLLAAGRQVVLVTGTNGKTTTTRLITAALGALGQDVASNAFGANMEAGLASALGRAPDAPYAVLETDERYLPAVIEATRPRVVVLLNLSRDQMDRAAEIWLTARKWREALAKADGLPGYRQCRRPADRLGCVERTQGDVGRRWAALARGLLVLPGVRLAPAPRRARLALRRVRLRAAGDPLGAERGLGHRRLRPDARAGAGPARPRQCLERRHRAGRCQLFRRRRRPGTTAAAPGQVGGGPVHPGDAARPTSPAAAGQEPGRLARGL